MKWLFQAIVAGIVLAFASVLIIGWFRSVPPGLIALAALLLLLVVVTGYFRTPR